MHRRGIRVSHKQKKIYTKKNEAYWYYTASVIKKCLRNGEKEWKEERLYKMRPKVSMVMGWETRRSRGSWVLTERKSKELKEEIDWRKGGLFVCHHLQFRDSRTEAVDKWNHMATSSQSNARVCPNADAAKVAVNIHSLKLRPYGSMNQSVSVHLFSRMKLILHQSIFHICLNIEMKRNQCKLLCCR